MDLRNGGKFVFDILFLILRQLDHFVAFSCIVDCGLVKVCFAVPEQYSTNMFVCIVCYSDWDRSINGIEGVSYS